MDIENPYIASASSPIAESTTLVDASKARRFWTFFIDRICTSIISALFGGAIGVIFGEEGAEKLQGLAAFGVAICIIFAYYLVMESIFSRSVGKLFTGVRVVSENGSPPTFKQVLIRTLCRFIPFEPFSFFGEKAHGWHDSISKTRVVLN